MNRMNAQTTVPHPAGHPKYNLTPPKELAMEERLRLDRCEKIIEQGLKTFEAVAAAFLEIRDGLLYRKTHSSFEAYCRERWNLGARRGRQLADAAEVMRNLAAPSPWPIVTTANGNHGSASRDAEFEFACDAARLFLEQRGKTDGGVVALESNFRWPRDQAAKVFDALVDRGFVSGERIVDPKVLRNGKGEQPELPTGERQVRPLTRLPKEEQKPAWAEARATAAKRGEPVTARDVEKAVERRANPEPAREDIDSSGGDGEAFQVATPAPAIKPKEKEKSQGLSTSSSPTKFGAMVMAQKLWSIAFRGGFPQEKERPWDGLPKSTRDGFISVAYFHLNEVQDLQRQLSEKSNRLNQERDLGKLQNYLLRDRGTSQGKSKAKPKRPANYLICRHTKGAKAKYWSGPNSWTNNPQFAKKLSAAAANVRVKKTKKWDSCAGDYVISLDKAAMRFAKAK